MNHHMVCLCSILQKAVLWEWIDRNPSVADKVKRPPQGDGRDSLLTVEEAGRLLDEIDGRVNPKIETVYTRLVDEP